MATEAELTEKYTEAFKNFSEDEATWKRENVDTISEGFPRQCKNLINFHFSEEGVEATTLYKSTYASPVAWMMKKANVADPGGYLAIATYLSAYSEIYPGDDFNDFTNDWLDTTDVREFQNTFFTTRCGKSIDDIEGDLDSKWNEHKNNQIMASAGFEDDTAVARNAGQEAVQCAKELVGLKELLGTAIEQFYANVGPSLFRNQTVLPRGGTAGQTGDEGFNYLNSLKETGPVPGYINLDTVSFGSSVSTVYPVITVSDSIASNLKFPERAIQPFTQGEDMASYPVFYFSMLLDIIKGAEYIYDSGFWPTEQEAANFYQGADDSSIPVLRKVGGYTSLQDKFISENTAVGSIEIEENTVQQNDVTIQTNRADFSEEQTQQIRASRAAGNLHDTLEAYTPNMLGNSSTSQIGPTPQDTEQLAEAYSRKVGIVDFISNYQQGVLPTISREEFPEEGKNFIDTILVALSGVLRESLSAAKCVKEQAKLFQKEKKKITDALIAAARNAGEGKTAWQAINPFDGGVDADLDLAAGLAQAAQNINDVEIEDTAFRSIEEKKLFKEQCFLLAFVPKFADYKKNTLDSPDYGGSQKRLPYASLGGAQNTTWAQTNQFNASLQIDGLPYGFINRLTQTPSYKSIVDIPHSILSHLQPRIRLFKVIYDDIGDETEVEIEFNSAFFKSELERTFKSKKARGAGVGLKNFEFTYDGSNPFAAKKSIKAKLSLFAASFSELFDLRTGNSTRINNEGELMIAGEHKYRYVDLALKTSNNPDQIVKDKNWARILEENGQLSKLNFRLKAVVGWSLPNGKISGLTTAEKTELNDALGDSFVTLNLTPTVHNFEFNDTGAVNFDINYLAYVDDFFDQRAFNVFANPNADTSWSREIRRLKYLNARKKCSTADSISQINDSYKEVIQKEMKVHLSSLIKELMANDRIYYVDVPYDSVQDFVAAGPYNDYENYVPVAAAGGDFIKSNTDNNQALAQLIDTAVSTPQTNQQASNSGGQQRNTIATQLVTSSPESNMVSFFYLSDLVDVVLSNIQQELKSLADQYANPQNLQTFTTRSAQDPITEEDFKRRRTDLIRFEKNFKRFRLLLGPVELHHVKKTDGKTSEFVNFGDIPISVKYFIEWVAGQVLSKDEIFYPLSVFLNQLMNNLVTNFLNSNRCFYFDIKQKVRVNQAVVSSYSPPNDEGTDTLTNLILQKSSGNHPTRLHVEDPIAKQNRPILNVSGRTGEQGITYAPLSHETNYLVFYAGRVASPSPVVDRAKDEEAGIFHYMLGRDRGLIKNIKLQKTQTKGLAEARFEMDGYDGLQQLRVVYDVNIDTYANVNTFPGTYIYIPPGGFDPSWSKYGFSDINMTSLGIGGYYMIIKSSHKFGPGEASSEIYAKWVNSLETDFPEADSSSDDPTDTAADPSCEGAADRINRATTP